MERILDEIMMKCNFAGNNSDFMFDNPKVKSYDFQIQDRLTHFKNCITEEHLHDEFDHLCEELEKLYDQRDGEVSRLFMVRGMAINLKLCTEILVEGQIMCRM